MDAPRDRSGFYPLAIFLIFSVVCRGLAFTDDDDFEMASDSVLTVEHTFDSGLDPVFTRRGTIVIRSIKSGAAEFSQDKPLNGEEIQKLKNLVGDDDVYRIRMSTKSNDGSTTYVSSFLKACALLESGLRDKITVHMDTAGSVIGVSLTAPIPYCTGGGGVGDLSNFGTTIDVMQTVQGPQPETQSYVEKIEREKAEKAQGQQQDNRSFFGKYWMYIVPLVILMLVAQNQDPNAAGGSGGGGGGGR